MNTPARSPGRNYSVALTTCRPKWHNFGLVCIFSLGVCELALLVKLQDSTKPWQSRRIQVYAPPFWLCFLNSLRSTGLKFPIWTHCRIRPGNRASPVKRLIWRGPQFRDSFNSDKQKLMTLEYPDIRREHINSFLNRRCLRRRRSSFLNSLMAEGWDRYPSWPWEKHKKFGKP